MKSRIILVFLTITVLFAVKANAQSIIAQVATFNPSEYVTCTNTSVPYPMNSTPGQTFKSLLTTNILSVQFSVVNIISSGTINLEIYSCSSATSWGSILGTIPNVTVNASGVVLIDASSLNIPVTANNYYGLRLVPNSEFTANLHVDDAVYADGNAWLSNVGFLTANNLTFTVTGNTVLPVQLTSFTAQKQNDHVLLQWNTANEQNAKDFTVQRSTDGSSWNNIGTVAAHGNSNTTINYSYVDIAPVTGMNYYRLLQTDIDGKSTSSETRAVKFSNDNKAFSIIVNPVNDGQLKVQVNKSTTLNLYDMAGKLLWKKQVVPGIQHINVSNYLKGIYLLKANETVEKVLLQ